MDVYEHCTTGIPDVVINFVFPGHSVLKSVTNSGHDGGHRVVVGDGAGSGDGAQADRLLVGGADAQGEDNRLVVLKRGVGGRVDRDGAAGLAGQNGDRIGAGASVVGALGGGAAHAVVQYGVESRGVIQRHRVDQVGGAIFQDR